nr:hypothetical protein [uncultured Sediminibacterium sp.]
MWEIIFVTMAGLVTIGLSINSILKSERQEIELKTKQDALIKAQQQIIEKQNFLADLQDIHSKEIKGKSDEVIRLQGLLQEKSDVQLNEINRIKNPIPTKLGVTFSTTLNISDKEFDEIYNAMMQVRPTRANQLPVDFNVTNAGVEKINAFKDMSLSVRIVFQNEDKSMAITIKPPLRYNGYNIAFASKNALMLFIKREEEKTIGFDGFDIETEDIKCNYLSPSLADFMNADVTVTFDFFFPQPIQVGSIVSKAYTFNRSIPIELSLEQIHLSHNNFNLAIGNFKKTKPNTFKGKAKFK